LRIILRARVPCCLCLFVILFSFMYLKLVRASPDVIAFVDGGSVDILTSETTLASLSTSFPAGNNFVISFQQLQCVSGGSPSILAQNLRLYSGGSSLLGWRNYYPIRLSDIGGGWSLKWFMLMAYDSGASANPTYEIKATADGTGIKGEAKILAISSVSGNTIIGNSMEVGTSDTQLASLSYSGSAEPKIVVAIIETMHDSQGTKISYVNNLELRRGTSTLLAEAQYADGTNCIRYDGDNPVAGTSYSWHVHTIPFYDTDTSSSTTYTVYANSIRGGSQYRIYARATIVAFGLGTLSAAYVDGGSIFFDTSGATLATLSTSFAAGSDVAVIASEQFMGSAWWQYINASYNQLQQNDDSGTQTVNQFNYVVPSSGYNDDGKSFGLLNRYTNTPASPTYKVKAKVGTTGGSPYGAYGEAKILAIAAQTPLTFNDKYVVTSTTGVTTTSTSLQDDTQAVQDFSLTASQTVLVIYQANNVHGDFMPQAYGMQNAIRVDGTDYANSWDSGALSAYAVRNTVFWIGTLNAGSHTVKGRFASGLSGSSATVSNRILLIYILNGNAYRYVDSSTTSTTSSSSFVDDPAAQFTFTPPGPCKVLILYNIANHYNASEDKNGKKAAIYVGGTDYAQAEKSCYGLYYADSVFTAWATSLSSSTTVKGRFACSIASNVYIHRRQLGILMFADSTLLNTVSSDTQVSTSSTSLGDDSEATISRTTTDARELLVIAMGTKRYNTADSDYGLCYGIKVDSNDRANSRGSPCTGSVYANSAATAYAEKLSAGSHTIKGRFATNYGSGTTKVDSRRIVALWLTCPPPVPEFPFGALILAIPIAIAYLCMGSRPSGRRGPTPLP